MKVKKKAIVSAVALSLLAAGCSSGSGGSTSSTSPSSSPGSSAAAVSTAPKNPNVKIVTNYNAATDVFSGDTQLNSNPILNYHNEKSGYKVTYEMLPKDDPKQKISLILAGGDVPDLMVMLTKEDYFKLAGQGAFLPLNDLLKKAPNYEKLVAKDVLDAAKVDGKLYALPIPTSSTATRGLLFRTDLLTELNLKEPTTLDEYYQVFKTIKEKKGIIPFTLAASGADDIDYTTGPIAGAFGVATRTVVKNNKLEFSYTQPEYKEFLTYMKKLYDEGLIDKEFAVLKTANVKEKIIGGQAASGIDAWWNFKPIAEALKTKMPNAAVKYLTLPVGPTGKSGIIQEPVVNKYFVVPKGAKNPEGAIEFFNYMASEDALKVQDYGLEGKNYKVDNGKVVQTLEESNAIGWRIVYQLMDTPANTVNRMNVKGFTPYYEPLLKDKQVREETYYAPSIDAYDKKLTELITFKSENTVKFIMGARSLNEFDDFVKEFNARGGTAAINAMNEWFTKK